MSKYYKADEVIEKIKSFGWFEAYEIAEAIESLPTIEIVRCEECKYRSEASSICNRMNKVMLADDFCSYGERKDNEYDK